MAPVSGMKNSESLSSGFSSPPIVSLRWAITLLKSCVDSSEQKVIKEQNQTIITQNQTMIDQNDQSFQQRQEIIDRLETAALALAEELAEPDDVEDGSENSPDVKQNDVQHNDANNEN